MGRGLLPNPCHHQQSEGRSESVCFVLLSLGTFRKEEKLPCPPRPSLWRLGCPGGSVVSSERPVMLIAKEEEVTLHNLWPPPSSQVQLGSQPHALLGSAP